MGPRERYQRDLDEGILLPDAAQKMAVEHLQRLYDELVAAEASRADEASGLVGKLKGWLAKDNVEPLQGLYFWGGVGRGKTYLMDALYDSLPFARKTRIHFHRFMQQVHRRLTALEGQKNPLQIVAAEIAEDSAVLCFDEFFVSDITDAMILAGVLEELFARGVTLVATSNIVPEGLYKDGLQRQRFLPAIALLEQYTEVVNVDGGVDYRLRVLEKAEIFHSPLDGAAETSLLDSFMNLAPDRDTVREGLSIEIENRPIATRYLDDDVVWFDFTALCDGPRSQNDYIEIARLYHAVLVGNVPTFDATKDDLARRFINLVDEFYDRNVKLILSAAAPIDQLYAGGRLEFEFERTQSRLLEMQSHDYLAREHKP